MLLFTAPLKHVGKYYNVIIFGGMSKGINVLRVGDCLNTFLDFLSLFFVEVYLQISVLYLTTGL